MLFIDLDGVIATQSRYAFSKHETKDGRNFLFMKHYFATPQLTSFGKSLLNGDKKFIILTNISPHKLLTDELYDEFIRDKKEWLIKHDFNQKFLCACGETKATRAEKYLNRKLCVSDVLIDNKELHCNQWNKAGGSSVLIETNWVE